MDRATDLQFPVVLCEEVPHRDFVDWRFRCPWCGRWHYHTRGAGPRASHCDVPGSPLSYILQLKNP
jgi:hypothetical protein